MSTAFYPLTFLAERIGGNDATVMSLTTPGAEPHDLELTPRQVADISQADLVVYLKGFQPAVDEAVTAEAPEASLDVSTVTPQIETSSGVDPHVWLDPERFAAIGRAVADRMAARDPAKAESFLARAADLGAQLDALDAEFRAGLASCQRTDIVTSHAAFGYLARAYGLQQVAITGLTPDAEASSGRLAEVARQAKADGVTTIFFEELVSPAVAESLAREVGATAVVLFPLEGPPTTGDYLTQMRGNLRALQTALGCKVS